MTSPSTAAAPLSAPSAPPADGRLPKGAPLVIGLLVAAAFVVILNETIMSVALPSLMIDLDIPTSTAQWLTTGFLLTMSVVIPMTGFILRRFTMRQVFGVAMTLFSLGTAIAAIAPGFGVLLLGRVVQASGTAIMIPLLMTTVLTLVPAVRRGRMMGVISIVIAVAPAIGPTVSGLILSTLSWRWMFIIVLPIAVIALALGLWKISNLTETAKVRLDVFSVALSTFAFGGLIYGLSSLGESGEGGLAVPVWVPLAVGALALAGFIGRQIALQKHDHALLDLRTFKTRSFAVAAVMMSVSMMALFGSLIILPLYLQNVLRLGTLETGLLLLPGGVLMGVLSPIVGRLFDQFGPRPLVIPGAVIVSVALWGMATLLHEGTLIAWVIGVHLLLNAGFAIMFTPLLTSALGALNPSLYAHGSATTSTLQQLAGAAGTALFVTVLSTSTEAGLAAGQTELSATAGGVQAAFLIGGLISLAAIVASFFVRRPTLSQTRGFIAH
ncbi:major facilitator transporter [Arthrobacter sp. ZBG10]|uniref:MDR family MFS transporter n=1 Tax=Arthrobacter sp. ZBG10 TaxID=1676590 RepID=UPI0006826AA4|nr:MDR family MFS transporter [Arthrobacter sp. ZBG10]KNH17404.1 major facilitator transporter [Arthrobacter sp. ZBG10]